MAALRQGGSLLALPSLLVIGAYGQDGANSTSPTPWAASSSGHCPSGWYATQSPTDCCCSDVADSPRAWVDRNGDSCADYAASGKGFCDSTGTEGPNGAAPVVGILSMEFSIGRLPLADYAEGATGGLSPLEACCACGGGRRPEMISDGTCNYDLPPASTCVNVDPLWTDNRDYNCTSYEVNNWCTVHGTTGSGWQSVWLGIDWYDTDGLSALDICCACGSDTKAEREAAAAGQISGAQQNWPAILSSLLSLTLAFGLSK